MSTDFLVQASQDVRAEIKRAWNDRSIQLTGPERAELREWDERLAAAQAAFQSARDELDDATDCAEDMLIEFSVTL